MTKIIALLFILAATPAVAHEYDMRKLKECGVALDADMASGKLGAFSDAAQAKQAREAYIEVCMRPYEQCHAALKDEIATGRLTEFDKLAKAEQGRVAYVEECLKTKGKRP